MTAITRDRQNGRKKKPTSYSMQVVKYPKPAQKKKQGEIKYCGDIFPPWSVSQHQRKKEEKIKGGIHYRL
jgi:hypothetical protein